MINQATGETILYIGIATATIGGFIIRELCPIGIAIMAVGAAVHDRAANKQKQTLLT
jgi:hypothetical protein